MYEGWPDFQRYAVGDDFVVFEPYADIGPGLVVPHRLEVATLADGRPDFRLTMVRGQNPLLPPSPYAMLDFRVRDADRLDAALALARSASATALVAPARLSAGELSLQLAGTDDATSADLGGPVRLAWNALGVARASLRLDIDAGTLVMRALENDALIVSATARVDVDGVAPRFPWQIRFDPHALLFALGQRHGSGAVAYAALLQTLARDVLPIEHGGEAGPEQRHMYASALADHLVSRYATAQLDADGTAIEIAFVDAAGVAPGQLIIDLARETRVRRSFALDLDPIGAARELVAEHGLDAVVTAVTVPPLDTGHASILVAANLPGYRIGVLKLGVTLHAPPRPPARMHALRESVVFEPPHDESQVALRFAPGEPREFIAAPFVFLRAASGVMRLEGEPAMIDRDRVLLSPDDFPVQFVNVSATAELLALATVEVMCHYVRDGEQMVDYYPLSAQTAAMAIALPRTDTDIRVGFRCLAHAGELEIVLPPQTRRSHRIGLPSFPGYGAHQAEVECVFDDEALLQVLEFEPEGLPQQRRVLQFTPQQPRRIWHWFAASPFAPGYRYRPFDDTGAQPAAWSALQSPFEGLRLSSTRLRAARERAPA